MECTFLFLLLIALFIWLLITLARRPAKGSLPRSSLNKPSITRSAPPKTPAVSESDYKNCPMCGEEIKTIAIKCKHCKSLLSDQHGSPGPVAHPLNQYNSMPSLDTPLEHKPRGEQLYVETMKISINLYMMESAEDRVELLNQLIDRYKQALALGLTKEDRVGCHASLSDALLRYVNELEIETPDQVAELGLEVMPNRLQAIQGLEKALEIDSTNENKFFSKKVNQTTYLPSLGTHWNIHGRYLNDTKGADDAISYLINKIKSLNYLGGTYMPDVCLSIGCYYVDTGNEVAAVEWFKKTLSAEEIDESNQQYEHYKKAKQIAMDNINSLES